MCLSLVILNGRFLDTIIEKRDDKWFRREPLYPSYSIGRPHPIYCFQVLWIGEMECKEGHWDVIFLFIALYLYYREYNKIRREMATIRFIELDIFFIFLAKLFQEERNSRMQ